MEMNSPSLSNFTIQLSNSFGLISRVEVGREQPGDIYLNNCLPQSPLQQHG